MDGIFLLQKIILESQGKDGIKFKLVLNYKELRKFENITKKVI